MFLNGEEITITQSWSWNTFNATVNLFSDVGVAGDILNVYIRNDGDYAFGYFDNNGLWVATPNQIHFDTAPKQFQVTVYKFSKHDIRKIERINLDVVTRNPNYNRHG